MKRACEQCNKTNSVRNGRRFCSPVCAVVWRTGKHLVPLAERFWAHVEIGDQDDCWHWLGSRDPLGYGRCRDDQRSRVAHAVAWELANNDVTRGFDVLHDCDVRHCCNPHHLHLGTQTDNNRERDQRDRFFRKVSLAEVREMRKLHKGGIQIPELVRLFKLSGVQTWKIVNYKQWIKPGDVE